MADDTKEIKTSADLLKELGEIKTGLEAKAKADAKAEVAEQLKAVNDKIEAVKGLPATVTADDLVKMKSDLEVTIKAFDLLQTRIKQTTGAPMIPQNAYSELGQKLAAKEKELKEFKHTKKGFGSIELSSAFDSKAVGNLSSAATTTGTYFVAPTVVPGVQVRQYEQVHLRDILPNGQTNSNVVRYVRDNGPLFTAAVPTMVAEGAAKPQIDRNLQIYDANVRKIATYFRVPEEMIDDIPYLQSFLTQIGIQEVMLVEDTQILYGDGTGQNLSGLFTNATAFDSPVTGPGTTDVNEFDVLLAARTQGRIAHYNTNVALVSPGDFYKMIEHKDSTNNYLFLGGGNGIDLVGTLNFRGILRVIEHTSVVAGDFLVFDPSKAAIFDRMGTEVRFYDQDQDNAIKNLITIVIEKRLALPIYQPLAFIKGTFATAKTDITTES